MLNIFSRNKITERFSLCCVSVSFGTKQIRSTGKISGTTQWAKPLKRLSKMILSTSKPEKRLNIRKRLLQRHLIASTLDDYDRPSSFTSKDSVLKFIKSLESFVTSLKRCLGKERRRYQLRPRRNNDMPSTKATDRKRHEGSTLRRMRLCRTGP
jgi:hypothetical protein